MKKFLIGLGVVVVVVILLLATGALKLSLRWGPPTQAPTAEQKASTDNWRTYANKDFGYLVSYPPDWIVRENTASGSREIVLSHPSSDGFVRIFSTLDPAVNSEETIRASLQDYEASFANKQDENLLAFKSDVQGALAGFMAAGKMKLNEEDYVFKERGLLSAKGRILIMRGAATVAKQKVLLPVAEKIMDSFQVQQ